MKKLLPNTLPRVPGGRKTAFFPHIRVYTEKLCASTPLMAKKWIWSDNFSVYTLFNRINCAKRGELAKRRGTAEQLFYIYPARSKDDQNMPT